MTETRYVGKLIRLTVEGSAVGEPRPRFDTKRGRTYTVKGKVHPWKKAVRRAALDALGIPFPPVNPVIPPKTPVTVRILSCFARPAHHYKARNRIAGVLREDAPSLHAVQPDADNLAKSILDALGPWPKGSAPILWQDDGLVAELHVEKRYTDLLPVTYITVFTETPMSVTSSVFLEPYLPNAHHLETGASSRADRSIGGFSHTQDPPDPPPPSRLQHDDERTEA